MIIRPKKVAQKWNFRLKIQGSEIGYFKSMSAPKSAVEQTPFNVGGQMDPIMHVPGKRTRDAVTFMTGVTENNELQQWYDQVGDFQSAGKELEELERKITCELLGRDGQTVIKTTELYKCVPNEFIPFDGVDADENGGILMQSLTVKYCGLLVF